MTVREVSCAADLMALDAQAAAVRIVMGLPRAEGIDLAAAVAAGDPLAQLVSASLGEDFVDRYAAAQVLGVAFPEPLRPSAVVEPGAGAAEDDSLVQLAAAVLGDHYIDGRTWGVQSARLAQ